MQINEDGVINQPVDEPCMNLWASVMRLGLQDAADAFKQRMKKATPSRMSPEEFWVFESDMHHPGSFLWLCDLFGIDANRVRNEARRVQKFG